MANCRVCNENIKNRGLNAIYCLACIVLVKRLENIYGAMKARCRDKKHRNYQHYKHLEIEKSWLEDSFEFVKFGINNGYKPGLTIDRIDNYKGYLTNNCRFVTMQENSRNKKYVATYWERGERKCCKCQTIKPMEEFRISRKEIGGRSYECKACRYIMDHSRLWKIEKCRRRTKRRINKVTL